MNFDEYRWLFLLLRLFFVSFFLIFDRSRRIISIKQRPSKREHKYPRVSGVYRLTGEHTPYMYTSVFLRCMCIDTREYSFSTELSDLLTRHTRLGTQSHVYVKFLGNGNTFLLGRTYVIYEARYQIFHRLAAEFDRRLCRKLTRSPQLSQFKALLLQNCTLDYTDEILVYFSSIFSF